MRAPRARGEADVYHVVSRGVGQQIIFETDADRRRYLAALRELVEELSGSLLAWCLMDNHVHLLLRMPMDDLACMMRRLHSGYALYYNTVHGRSGHLFQGRFSSEPVETDEYLMTVVRYIHRNPVKAGVTTSCSYAWSSYDSYASWNIPPGAEMVAELFGDARSFRVFHENDRETTACLDVLPVRRRVDNETARRTALAMFGDAGLANLKALPRGRRDAALARLKGRGLTVRQIQLLTGISMGVISKA